MRIGCHASLRTIPLMETDKADAVRRMLDDAGLGATASLGTKETL
jgi:hypothetical protein